MGMGYNEKFCAFYAFKGFVKEERRKRNENYTSDLFIAKLSSRRSSEKML